MKLLHQTHSPFSRKVLVFAHEVGLAGRIEVIHHETSPVQRNAEVFGFNPLGKVPVLLRADRPPVFDSDVICQLLDTVHDGPQLTPPEGEARWRALTLQALAQGLAEAGIALRWEQVRRPPPLRHPALAEGLTAKLTAGYDWLERELESDLPPHVGHVALATALSWIEFRSLPDFRTGRTRLSAWLDGFAGRPSMKATPLTGETQDGPAE